MSEIQNVKSFKELMTFLDRKVKEFDAFDIGLLKMTVLSFGLFIGSCYSRVFKKIAWLLGIFSMLGSLYFIVKVFFKDSVPYYKIR